MNEFVQWVIVGLAVTSSLLWLLRKRLSPKRASANSTCGAAPSATCSVCRGCDLGRRN